MKPATLICIVLALCGVANAARELRDAQGRQLGELPASIVAQAGASILLSADVVDPAWACSPAYYNCLGVEPGQPCPLSWCQDGLVFDKTFPWTPESPVPATQGGACNWWTPACGVPPVVNPGQSTAPVVPGQSSHPVVPPPVVPVAPVVVVPAVGTSTAPVVTPVTHCALPNYDCVDGLNFCLGGYVMLCAPGTVCRNNHDGLSPCNWPL